MKHCLNHLWLWKGWPILCCWPEKAGRGFEKYEGKWTEKVKTNSRKKFLAVREACRAIFWPIQGFKRRTSVSSGFSTEGTLISVSTVPHCGYRWWDSKPKRCHRTWIITVCWNVSWLFSDDWDPGGAEADVSVHRCHDRWWHSLHIVACTGKREGSGTEAWGTTFLRQLSKSGWPWPLQKDPPQGQQECFGWWHVIRICKVKNAEKHHVARPPGKAFAGTTVSPEAGECVKKRQRNVRLDGFSF